jgi:hypothetical protein
MLSKASVTIAAAALALSASFAPTTGWADVKTGTLTCDVDSGWGFVLASSRNIKCTFAHNGTTEHYLGKINKFGADIGYTGGGVIAWVVFAPSNDVDKGALAGDYGGVTGAAAVGVGVGAHVLVGGFKDSFSLQPLSVEGFTGLNVAGGIANVTLTYQPEG